jgi:hypothetical protein
MRPTDGRFSLWPLGLIGFFLVLALVSITPVKRLNEKPPSDFLWLRTTAGKPNVDLARQYWNTAGKVLQWRYHPTDPLPAEPPDDFRPTTADGNSPAAFDHAARRAYWHELRGEWLTPDNWHTSYTIDAMWMWRDLSSIWGDLVNFVKHSS